MSGQLTPAPKVVIVYRYVPHYRVRFYELLREKLAAHGVTLEVVYGQPLGEDASKDDAGALSWGCVIHNRAIRVAGRELIWQPCLNHVAGADLVIVEQASRLVVNYVLLIRQAIGRQPTAFWGHGRKFQDTSAIAASEWVKRRISKWPAWWFAYNETSASVVRDLGYPSDRITVVENSIDTKSLAAARDSVVASEVEALRDELGLSGHNVCVYCGGMYAEKRLGFLLEAATLLRESVPDFELVLAGAGTDAHLAAEASATHPWVKYIGTVFGRRKAALFATAKLHLMPGLVGLAVLDSFVMEVPLVTTAVTYHSPEIEYLSDGRNGLIVPEASSPSAFAVATATLLGDDARLESMKTACRADARRYTIENMAERFCGGVLSALSYPRSSDADATMLAPSAAVDGDPASQRETESK